MAPYPCAVGISPPALTLAELTLTAALAASALTGLASLGAVGTQERRRRQTRDREALRAAVGELMSRSVAIAMRSQAMGETMKVRSGLKVRPRRHPASPQTCRSHGAA